ncbi:helix-turn-helix domain-containing protein [Mycobacterium avium subsp. hominissuis]|uniref:helix-turn-helix domain-containing protein n=1 Tax=Mycobacterium avium TaxID=1764 RepID=UPI001CC4957D|nr:helix-turn-helix domain-containing protein [Mycobacterium avium]MBZ4509114.1 helix-turn-helix domain-containing protein [Mycobacterium avium subsp. hominissuis]
MTGFNKHKWLDAVEDDARITPAEGRVLLRIGRRYVLNGDSTFRVQQTTLAARCRVDVRTVRRAITKGRALGYLTLVQERQRGRSHHAADQYRLVIPSEITGQNCGQSGSEIPDSTPSNTGQHTIEIPDSADASTCGNVTSTVITTGLKGTGTPDGPAANSEPATFEPDRSGDGPPEDQSIKDTPEPPPAATAAPDLTALPVPPIHWPDDYPRSEPPVRCPKHANHHGWLQETCPPCGSANKAHKAWEAERAQWRKDRAAAIQAWIAACDQCDEAGWLMDDTEDELPAMKCLHAPNVIAWSALHPDWQLHGPYTTQHRRAS